MPQAVRTPVNEPGPEPKAIASQSFSAMPASASNSWTIGSIDWEWVRTPSETREMTESPRSSAQEACSDDVSMARMVSMPYFNPAGPQARPCEGM
jgi:hypothetical protein